MNFVALKVSASSCLAPYSDLLNASGARNNVPPCLGGAIVTRESQGRNTLQIGVPPGPGCGVGLGQITWAVDWTLLSDPVWRATDGSVYHLLNPADNIECMMKEFLVPLICHYTDFKAMYPTKFRLYAMDQIAFAVCAGYNADQADIDGAILAGTSVDAETTNNYASWTFQEYLNLCVASAKC